MFKFSGSKSINFAKLHRLAENLWSQIPAVKKYRQRQNFFKIFKILNFSILIIFLLIIIFLAGLILTFKQIYGQTLAGKNNLEQAVELARTYQFNQAEIYANAAINNFDFAISQLEPKIDHWLIKNSLFLSSQFNDTLSLLYAANFLSQAVSQATSLGKEVKFMAESNGEQNFSKLTQAEKKQILAKIFQSTPELAGLKANLELAFLNLEQIKFSGLLWPLKTKILSLQYQLIQTDKLLDQAVQLSQILPIFVGYPEKSTFLIVLENNDELRPTGGFIGSYGILETEAAEIIKFETHDIYHLDMPVKDKINYQPPPALKKYLKADKWFMRDANWSPDWPTAAETIKWFFEMENGLQAQPEKINKFNGVMAITPKLITDLLAVTGSVVIEGIEYNQNNFQDLLQYKVEKGYIQLGVPAWQRKEVIGQIASQLKIKIFDLPLAGWQKVAKIIEQNLLEKNLLIYLTDSQQENLIKEYGWAGEIKATDGDYLMVVDANLAALKTDAVISRSISYRLEQGANGLFAKLTVSYAHHGSFDWKTTRYRSYTRVYLPTGSQLIKATGIGEEPVKVETELGKTCLATFIILEPGKIGSLSFDYKLPDNLAKKIIEDRQYNLLIQKQPGSQVSELVVDLKFADQLKSYNPATLFSKKLDETQVSWQTDLNIDREFEVKF